MNRQEQLDREIEELCGEFDGEILGIAIVTLADLDGRQTRDDFQAGAVGDRMLRAGLDSLREQTRPGCDCDTCTDSTCPEVGA
jgi:hypothetical protein